MQLHSNHASSESPNGYGNQHLYDGEGRICAVATPKGMFQYLYDADGTRVAKGTIQLVNNALSCDTTQNQFRLTASYILDPGGQQLTELNWTSGTAQWAHTNVWAAGQLIATYSTQNRQGILNFYFDDWLGSRRVMTDYTGNVQETCHSLPYGNGEDCGPAPTEHLFTGKERDQESGNDYFLARYYGSSMGRFLSPDGPFDGSDQENPQSWNLYSYVQNNPLIGVDPDGHDCVIQTRVDDKHETVKNQSGNCSGVKLGEGQSATYVNGTVDGWKAGADGHSLDISYHNDSGNGVENASAAPAFDHPGMQTLFGPNAGGPYWGGANSMVKGATAFVALTAGSVGGAIVATDLLAGGGARLAGVGRSGASVANRLWHIFGNPEHGLGPLVQKFGGPAAAYEAIQKAAQEQVSVVGAFKAVWVQVGGMNIQVNGTVINGVVKISTAYVPH